MKHFIKKALYFLRLTDDNGLLSITHIACMVVLAKVAMEKDPSIVDMGSLLITLSLYYGKQHLNKNKVKIATDTKDKVEQLEQKVKEAQGKISSLSAIQGLGGMLKT